MAECVEILADPGIETLAAVYDPARLAGHVREACPRLRDGDALEDARVVRVLKHHAGQRCTLEIGLRTRDGWRPVIGKVYAADRSDVFRAMTDIERAGFGTEAAWSIPRPIAYVAPLNLLLQEKLDGLVAKDVFKTGDDEGCAAAAARCAVWLARFQAAAPQAGPVFDTDACLREAEGRTRRVAKLGGPAAGKAARLLSALEHAATALGPVPMCAGHGSYSPAQIMLADARTATFDWDGYDVAVPARDAARFVAALRRLALGKRGSIRALDGAAHAFLAAYQSAGPRAAEEHLRFFEAAACHTLAAHHLSHQVSRWPDKVNAMLDEGLRILEGASR